MNQKKRMRRLLALTLCVCMGLALLPGTSALAANGGVVTNWAELMGDYGSGTTIVIPKGTTVAVAGILDVPDDGKMYTLTGGGALAFSPYLQALSGEVVSMLRVGGGAKLTLENAALDGGGYWMNCAVLVCEDGAFTMSGGSITGWRVNDGAVFVDDSGTFTMSGGSIAGNSGFVGGVQVGSGSAFHMSGGSITGNKGAVGGVVVNPGSTFRMSGGSITGNRGDLIIAAISGETLGNFGGVCVGLAREEHNGASFTISGSATITGNTDAAGLPSNAILIPYPGDSVEEESPDSSEDDAKVMKIAGKLTGAIGITVFGSDDPEYLVAQGADYTITQDDFNRLSSDEGLSMTREDNAVYMSLTKDLRLMFGGINDIILEGLETDDQIFCTYNGSVQTPTGVILEKDGTALVEGTDYTWNIISKDARLPELGGLGYTSAGKNTGLVMLAVTGKGDYRGAVYGAYVIDPKEITPSGAVVADTVYHPFQTILDVTSVTFDGLVAGETLGQNADYAAIAWLPDGETLSARDDQPVVVEALLMGTPKARNYRMGSAFAFPTTCKVAPAPLTGVVSIHAGAGIETIGEGTVLAACSNINGYGSETLDFQWYRDDEAIAGETDITYTLTAEDAAGARITVKVTASGNYTGDLTSAPVVVGMKALGDGVTIAGPEDYNNWTAGAELTLDTTELVEGATYSIRWLCDGAPIPGATGDTYTLTKFNSGKLIAVVITGTGDYTGALSNSAHINPTAPDAPILSAAAGDGQVTLSWEKPFDGGSPIFIYFLEVWEGSPEMVSAPQVRYSYHLGPSVTGYTIAELQNGAQYSFVLTAISAIGYAESQIVSATPAAGGSGPTGPTGSGSPAPAAPNTGDNTLTTPGGQAPVVDADGNATLPGGGTLTTPGGSKIDLPPGTTIDKDGNVTIPEGKEAELTLPAGQEATLPGGSTIDGNGTITTGGDMQINLPGDKTIDVPEGTTIGNDGKLTVGAGGATVTGGLTLSLAAGAEIMLDEGVPLGYLVLSGAPFADVTADAWYYAHVMFAYAHGLMNGTGEGGFSPNAPMTRGMFVTVLARLDGADLRGYTTSRFNDVKTGQWYAASVEWAAEMGIVSGMGDGSFAPDAPITREQLMAILYRYVRYTGGGFEGTWAFLLTYADLDAISEWAYEAVSWCTMTEVVSGKPGNMLDPRGMATRAEVAAVLERFVSTFMGE